MIVKDEEEWIAQCLQSVSSVIHEAIVVDTGSTDKTVEIAKAHGAQVYHFAWIDDFAAARNFSLAHATGDWILVLDADEMIAPSDLHSLVMLTKDRTICTEFLQRHYTNDYRLSDFSPCRGEFSDIERGHAGYFESNCVRFFPHGEGLEFRGRVHELVEHSIAEQQRFTIVRTPIRIHHFGHTEAVRKRKNKNALYAPLGERKTNEEPNNWKAYFEIGVEHNVHGRRQESVQALRKAAELNPGYINTWINLGYALMELGEYPEAMKAYEQALKIDPKSSETLCNIGVVGMRTNDHGLAERASIQALSINPKYVNAALNLARTYSRTNRLSECMLLLRYVLHLIPRSVAALADIGAVYIQGGFLALGERYLREALAIDPTHEQAKHNLALITSQQRSG